MKTILSIAFTFLSIISFAQIEQIEVDIAAYDAKIGEAIAEEMEMIIPHLSTTCPLMLPAIGPVNHNIDIYFDLFQEESEIDGEGMQMLHNIRKVSFQIMSGSYQMDFTYYFNENGEIIFQSERVEDESFGCTLTSYYFKNNKCIQVKSELLATEFCELATENQPEIRTELSDIEKHTVKTTLENAAKFKKLLSVYMGLMLG